MGLQSIRINTTIAGISIRPPKGRHPLSGGHMSSGECSAYKSLTHCQSSPNGDYL